MEGREAKLNALRGNRTPGGSSQYSNGNDPGYHYPINALGMGPKRYIRAWPLGRLEVDMVGVKVKVRVNVS